MNVLWTKTFTPRYNCIITKIIKYSTLKSQIKSVLVQFCLHDLHLLINYLFIHPNVLHDYRKK